MTRLLIFVLSLVSGRGATADVVVSPTPCVNREAQQWRLLRDIIVDAKALQYCTGNDCWSMDLSSGTVTGVARRAPAARTPHDPAGTLTDGQGTTLATADETHAVFCPLGGKQKAACKTFQYKFNNPATNGVFVKMNARHTLGAVLYQPDYENGLRPQVVAFDLVRGKQLANLPAEAVEVLDNGFLIDRETFYDAAGKSIGKIAAPDQVWIALGSTDLIALRDTANGELVIQETTTAKVRARIPTGVADRAALFALRPSADGTQFYAIGQGSDEGEVLVVDVATAKIVSRTTPIVCRAGTRRIN